MLVVFPPIFVADTKIVNGYNFVAPLIISLWFIKVFMCVQKTKINDGRVV